MKIQVCLFHFSNQDSQPPASQIDNFLKVLSKKTRGCYTCKPEKMVFWTNKQVFMHAHTHTQQQRLQRVGEPLKESFSQTEMKADRTNFSRKEEKKRPRRCCGCVWQDFHTFLASLPLYHLIALCEHLPSTSNNKWTRAASFIHHAIWAAQAAHRDKYLHVGTKGSETGWFWGANGSLIAGSSSESELKWSLMCLCVRQKEREEMEGLEAKKKEMLLLPLVVQLCTVQSEVLTI